jgi:hypothetical protein
MQYEQIRRKQPTTWPWLMGLVILGIIVWSVNSLLGVDDPEGEPRPAVTFPEDTLPPAAIPAPPVRAPGDRAARPIEEIAPLGEEDIGERVRAEGEVLATGTMGFWMLAGNEVLRVDSDRYVQRGEVVQVSGTLLDSDPMRTERVVTEVISRLPGAEGWRVAAMVRLVEGAPVGLEPAAPATAGEATGEAAGEPPPGTGDAGDAPT